MLSAIVLASLLSASPVKSLAAPGFQCANLDPKLVDSFMTHFAQQLSVRGFQVTTPSEVSALLGLERQKQLLACSDSGCNTEIAAALGVDALITGSVAKVGKGYLVNIKILQTSNGAALAVYSARPKSDDELLDFLEGCAKKFVEQYPPPAPDRSAGAPPVAAKSGADDTQPAATQTAETVAPGSSPRVLPWVVGAAGVAALIAGGVFTGLAQSSASQLKAGKATDYAGLQSLQSSGRMQETLGYSLLGGGAALVVASAVLFLFGSSSSNTNVALMPAPTGAALCLWGNF